MTSSQQNKLDSYFDQIDVEIREFFSVCDSLSEEALDVFDKLYNPSSQKQQYKNYATFGEWFSTTWLGDLTTLAKDANDLYSRGVYFQLAYYVAAELSSYVALLIYMVGAFGTSAIFEAFKFVMALQDSGSE